MSVPEYPELSVKNMYMPMKEDVVVSQYVPDYKNNMLPDKEFFHKLICTLYPEQMYDIIMFAYKHRGVEGSENDEEMIELDAEIAREIENVVLLPSNIHLLIRTCNCKTSKDCLFIEEKDQRPKTKKGIKEVSRQPTDYS